MTGFLLGLIVGLLIATGLMWGVHKGWIVGKGWDRE